MAQGAQLLTQSHCLVQHEAEPLGSEGRAWKGGKAFQSRLNQQPPIPRAPWLLPAQAGQGRAGPRKQTCVLVLERGEERDKGCPAP